MSGLFDMEEQKEKPKKLRIKIEAYDGDRRLFSEEYEVSERGFFRKLTERKRANRNLYKLQHHTR